MKALQPLLIDWKRVIYVDQKNALDTWTRDPLWNAHVHGSSRNVQRANVFAIRKWKHWELWGKSRNSRCVTVDCESKHYYSLSRVNGKRLIASFLTSNGTPTHASELTNRLIRLNLCFHRQILHLMTKLVEFKRINKYINWCFNSLWTESCQHKPTMILPSHQQLEVV